MLPQGKEKNVLSKTIREEHFPRSPCQQRQVNPLKKIHQVDLGLYLPNSA